MSFDGFLGFSDFMQSAESHNLKLKTTYVVCAHHSLYLPDT